MPISIAVKSLASRVVRETVTGDGIRTINTDFSFTETKDDGGFLNKVFRAARQLAGFLVSGAKNLIQWGLSKINFGRIWSWIVSSVTRLSVFDWNSTDAELTRLQANNNLDLFAQWGGVVGAGAGWLTGIAVGYGIGLAVPVIGGASLARTIAATTTGEAIDELQGYLGGAIQRSIEVAASNTLIEGYKRARGLIKKVPRNRLAQLLGKATADFIYDEWGLDGAPSLTMAQALEDDIDRIGDERLRAFVENAADEFFDSFIESGYIIANELDTAYQQYKMQNNRMGSTASRAVTILPDSQDTTQKFFIQGTETEVKEQAQQIITNARVLGSREIGEWVGQPVDDYLRGKFHRRKATIVYKEIEGKGFYFPDGRKARTATYTIPELGQILTWEEIKRATRAYNWGEFRATANLDNGRQMAVYGATSVEAEEKLRDLLDLSSASILTLSISQEKDRDYRIKKRIIRMYPYQLKLLVRKLDPDGSSYFDAEGNAYRNFNFRIPLWVDEEPPEFSESFLT